MKFLFLYLLIVNAAGFLVMTLDKLLAKKNARRIPERTLLTLAAIGGSIGVLAAMYAVRHKTRHAKFFLGVPAILIVQTALFLYFLLQR